LWEIKEKDYPRGSQFDGTTNFAILPVEHLGKRTSSPLSHLLPANDERRSKLAGVTTHHTSIDLATKVTDTPEKLAHTLAHELCHVAAWVLSDEIKPSHGAAFKLWFVPLLPLIHFHGTDMKCRAARIMSLRSDIQITTTHSYEISYKYRWRCTFPPCSKMYRLLPPSLPFLTNAETCRFSRHSKSIDPSTHGCPCGNKLVAIDQEGGIKPSVLRAPKSSWQEYLSVCLSLFCTKWGY
jgi:predicted SprT family Zn-dependent metalloprotease